MKKIISLLFLLFLTSCISISVQAPTAAASQAFITATLPPGDNSTARPTRTLTVVPTVATRSATEQAGCKDSAILVADVTIPDNTRLAGAEKFTKTWQLQNVGKCTWTGYKIIFVSGDRMNAPDSVPVPETAVGKTVDVSVDLVAPSNDGTYTGFFSLQNSSGDTVQIGTQTTLWLKILVGSASALVPPQAPVPSSGTPIVPQGGNNGCSSTQNASYVSQLFQLINAARAQVDIARVTMDDQLKSAAQKHSDDMACNNFLDHTGSDGSWISDRIIKAGYSPSYFAEIIAVGTPQNAIDQWAADAPHWKSVLDPKVSEIGIGYSYYADSDLGGYFTVDLGSK